MGVVDEVSGNAELINSLRCAGGTQCAVFEVGVEGAGLADAVLDADLGQRQDIEEPVRPQIADGNAVLRRHDVIARKGVAALVEAMTEGAGIRTLAIKGPWTKGVALVWNSWSCCGRA